MVYLKKIFSLEEKASAQIAINLCQDSGFKEAALCLEKPTFGIFIEESFISDPEKLSTWSKVEHDKHLRDNFINYCWLVNGSEINQWDKAIVLQCQRLTEGLPHFLKHGIHAWINRIALEYLSYSWRQEAFFGVSRYFLMNILSSEDWTAGWQLNEEKLVERLLKDEQLTVLQRYRIACVNCFHEDIPQLWKKLTHGEKQWIIWSDFQENSLVLLWSRNMSTRHKVKELQRKKSLWTDAAHQAVSQGNRMALMQCWKKLEENVKQQMVIDMALKSMEKWQSTKSMRNNRVRTSWRRTLVTGKLPHGNYNCFYLPFYCSELLCFFLSEMNKEQQLTFFKKAFQSKNSDSVLECFLDWPYQDNFLPVINQLWGMVPKDKYGQCLLNLAIGYSGDYETESRYYDYRSLLWKLWEDTPDEYKQYVFLDKELCHFYCDKIVTSEGKILLHWLLGRFPFQEKDKVLFKRVLHDAPQDKRKAIMYSVVGDFFPTLTQRGNWSFVKWLLEECLSKEEISSFKKEFIQTDEGRSVCFYALKENHEKLLEDLIDWSFELDTEKTQFKYGLIDGIDCLSVCKSFLIEGEIAEVERIIDFCVMSNESKKQQFKEDLAHYTRDALYDDSAWDQINEIIAWTGCQ